MLSERSHVCRPPLPLLVVGLSWATAKWQLRLLPVLEVIASFLIRGQLVACGLGWAAQQFDAMFLDWHIGGPPDFEVSLKV